MSLLSDLKVVDTDTSPGVLRAGYSQSGEEKKEVPRNNNELVARSTSPRDSDCVTESVFTFALSQIEETRTHPSSWSHPIEFINH